MIVIELFMNQLHSENSKITKEENNNNDNIITNNYSNYLTDDSKDIKNKYQYQNNKDLLDIDTSKNKLKHK